MWNLGVKAYTRSTQWDSLLAVSCQVLKTSHTNIAGPFAKKLEANKISKD